MARTADGGAPDPGVGHDPGGGRFWIEVDGHRGVLDYRRDGATLVILHTVVPSAVGGRGIAGRLVETAVRHARAEGLAVDSTCSYASSWLERRAGEAGEGTRPACE